MKLKKIIIIPLVFLMAMYSISSARAYFSSSERGISSGCIKEPTYSDVLEQQGFNYTNTSKGWGWNVNQHNDIQLVADSSAKYGKVLKMVMVNSTGGSSGWYYYIDPLELGKNYTFYVKVKGPSGRKVLLGHESNGRQFITLNGNWQNIAIRFNSIENEQGSIYRAIDFYSADWIQGDEFYIKDMSLIKTN